MTEPFFTEVVAKCPSCATVNRLVTNSDRDRETVSCSRCGISLGRWGQLKTLMASRNPALSR